MMGDESVMPENPLQGYLAHKKLRSPLGSPQGPRFGVLRPQTSIPDPQALDPNTGGVADISPGGGIFINKTPSGSEAGSYLRLID